LVEQVSGNSPHFLCIDGGIKGTADFCKAVALGAHLVMMGRPFSAVQETCSPITEIGAHKYKEYFGMASAKAKGNSEFVEGAQGRVRFESDTVHEVFKHYEQALRSAMSYVDALTLEEYRTKAEVIRVTNSTQLENSTRLDAHV
jgi:IMP dehydrogenase/GMP reductase